MKKARTSAVHPDEASLFRASMSDVTPLSRPKRVEHARSLPRPVPAQRLRDNRETLVDSLSDQHPWDAGMETGDELLYARNGIGSQTLRKLRRGHWVIQGELDLHGLTTEEARQRLVEFLNASVRRGARCVRIIHGKGLRSGHRGPVLKGAVSGVLRRTAAVVAFVSARPVDGGTGALYVLLSST